MSTARDAENAEVAQRVSAGLLVVKLIEER